jgi:hypothetical protein
MIIAKIIADSLNTSTGDRLTSFLITYPRYILAELNTHRAFSRNTASSRAIPVKKFRDDVTNNPVIPTHWGANQKGMQATAELDDTQLVYSWWPEHPDIDGSSLPCEKVTARKYAELKWLSARDQMLKVHSDLEILGLHKQLANRLLEAFFWCTTIVSATEWQNFFALRCHKDAHPDIQALADQMLDAYMLGTPTSKIPGEWHLPYGDQDLPSYLTEEEKVKICVARAARISYKTFEGEINLKADFELHDRLLTSGHMSPFEHPARAMLNGTWSGNFRGFEQYRKMLSGENKTVNLQELWAERKIHGTIRSTVEISAPEKQALDATKS